MKFFKAPLNILKIKTEYKSDFLLQKNMRRLIICCIVLLYNITPMTSQFAPDTSEIGAPIKLTTKSGELYGSLTLPKAAGTFPVALIIAGSGPTDRNGNNPAMKNDAYKKLSKELALRNIATLRYDKRGVAASRAAGKEESALRFEDYAEDARQWVQLLKRDARFSEIAIIGHSEGSLIGMLAAQSDVAKFISLAGAGRPADELIKEQLAAQPQFVRDAAYPILDSLKKGIIVKNISPMYAALFRESVQPYMISWFKYDPRDAVKKLSIPVLILQGTNDLQVKVADAEQLHAANPKSKLVLLENVNHILRKIRDNKDENLSSYNNPLLPIDTKCINEIADFIQKK